MFKTNDKITLTIVNARDINDKVLPFSLKIPLEDMEYSIPEETVSVDVFEYQEGSVNQGFIAFHIYVGKISTINELIAESNGMEIKIKSDLDISAIESDVCYQNVEGQKYVFATLDEQDVVVQDHEQLRNIIGKLSDEYDSLFSLISKVKLLSKSVNIDN